jgi:uncharacterized protein (DUF362 family)
MRIAMKSRREFIKNTATGALLLGSSAAADKLGFADLLDKQHTANGKSRVVVARDAALHGQDGQLDEKRVLALLDRAMATYTGHDNKVQAWKSIVPMDKVIGMKVNGLGGKGISTHAALVMAVCERLQQAGVKPGNILVWDRYARDLQGCGLTVSTDPNHIRVYGSDVAGYETDPAAFGSAVNVKLAKILTRECDMVLNLPILKDHEMAGVTFSMKNMYGVIQHPNELHAAGCNPGVADLNCIPVIRQKVRFTIGDAMTSVYDGGPGFHPERLWQPNALIVGEDRVAIDHTAWRMIERKRAEVGMPTLEGVGRPPRYIATAADAAHGLGVNDPKRIQLLEV